MLQDNTFMGFLVGTKRSCVHITTDCASVAILALNLASVKMTNGPIRSCGGNGGQGGAVVFRTDGESHCTECALVVAVRVRHDHALLERLAVEKRPHFA